MLRPALLLSVVAAVAVAGAAGAAPSRTAGASYLGPAMTLPAVTVAGTKVPVPQPPVFTVAGRTNGGSGFDTSRAERTVQVLIVDDSGRDVGATVTQDVAGKRIVLGTFCGGSPELRLVAAGQPVRVAPSRTCGLPTTGRVTLSFR